LKRDERAQLIVAMGVVLAFTLMAIGSNATFLNYTKKSRSYTSTSSGDLTGNPEVLGEALEWKLNSELIYQAGAERWRLNLEKNIEETLDEIADVYAPHGIQYELLNFTEDDYYRDRNAEKHLIYMNINISVDDGLNRVVTPYTLTIIDMISDPWPDGAAFNAITGSSVSFGFRIPVAFHSGDIEREDEPVRCRIDFDEELARLGFDPTTSQVDLSTITVAEHDDYIEATSPGGILKAVHAHTYIGDTSIDDPHSGKVIWTAQGRNPADTYRWFYIYFDLVGGPSSDISPDGDLMVTDDGWVSNGKFTAEFLNGSYLRIAGTDIGPGGPGWSFTFNNVTTLQGGWDTWTIIYNSTVYAEVETTKGGLTRLWKFYNNSALIEIQDSWSVGGDRSAVSFRTEQLGYMGGGRYSYGARNRIVSGDNAHVITNSRLTELPLPDEPLSGTYAAVMHHDNAWNFYAYFYPYDEATDVDWMVSSSGYERMVLWQDNSVEITPGNFDMTHSYYMYMYYDIWGLGNSGADEVLRELEGLVDPPVTKAFYAHAF